MGRQGNPKFLEIRNTDTSPARQALQVKADKDARRIGAEMVKIQTVWQQMTGKQGEMSNTAMAKALVDRCVRRPRGGFKWDATAVRKIKERLGNLDHQYPEDSASLLRFLMK